MTIFVLFGQRKETRTNEFPPEALAVSSNHSQHPEHLQEQMAIHLQSGKFAGLRICEISVGSPMVLRGLILETPAVQGQVRRPDRV